jgi:hypothetical protein
MRPIVALLIALSLLPLSAPAQFRLPDIIPVPDVDIPDLPVKIPGLGNLFEEGPTLTTSLEDAQFGVPFLDDFDPYFLTKMTHLPRGPNGDFLLVRPGVYQHNFESYCLHAGAYGPGSGEGYLFAPLKGPRAGVILSVLHGSFRHPDVPQQQIQSLIWAILARTKVSDMPTDLRGVARLLLAKKEISALNGGAVGQIPPELYDKVFGDVPAPLRRVYEAEAGLRSAFAQGVSEFGELERVAVLAGDPPETEEGPETPSGRWSYHPDGYFIRYFPTGYSKTRVQLYLPEPFTVERDDQGRITLVADQYGDRIEATYDDGIDPLSIAGDDGVQAYAFGSIRFVRRIVLPPEISIDREETWESTGMTLVGVPSGEGRVTESRGRFADIGARYEWAQSHRQEVEGLVKAVADFGGGAATEGDLADIMDLAHFAVALKATLGEQLSEEPWLGQQIGLVQKAWQRAVCRHLGTEFEPGAGGVARSGRAPVRLASLDILPWLGTGTATANGDRAFGSDSGAAQPGDPDRQRLALGDEDPETDKGTDPDIEKVKRELAGARIIRDCFAKSDPSAYDNVDDYVKDVQKSVDAELRKQGLLSGEQKSFSPMATRCDGAFVPGGKEGDPDYARDWESWYQYNSSVDWVKEWVRANRFAGDPDIIFDAAFAHEQVHRDTFKSLNDPCEWAKDPKNYRQDDLKAYDKQIGMLEDWLKHDC